MVTRKESSQLLITMIFLFIMAQIGNMTNTLFLGFQFFFPFSSFQFSTEYDCINEGTRWKQNHWFILRNVSLEITSIFAP